MSATVTTLPGSTFDGTNSTTYLRDTLITETATTYAYATTGGHRITLLGNFTYPDGPGANPAGAITEILIDQDNDGTNDINLAFTGNLPMAENLNLSGPNLVAFWDELLDGDDLLIISSDIASDEEFAADGFRETSFNAGDDIIVFTGSGEIIGDANNASTGEGFTTGGDDDLTVETLSDATVIGDFEQAFGSLPTIAHNNIGGDDIILDQSAAGGAVHLIIGDFAGATGISSLIELGQITGGDDIITGTSAPLIVVGDIDTITGDNFRIVGGADTITAGSANDELYGDVRSFIDFINDNEGDNNSVTGGADDISGGAGDDLIVGDVGHLGEGNAFTGGNDILNGNAGNDIIYGDYLTNASSFIVAGGNDIISGGFGNDILFGQEGDDIISGGTGADTIDGGAGIDTGDYTFTNGDLTVNLDTGQAFGTSAGFGGETITNVENLILGGGDDLITGDAGNNVIDAGAGDDMVDGGAGDDVFIA